MQIVRDGDACITETLVIILGKFLSVSLLKFLCTLLSHTWEMFILVSCFAATGEQSLRSCNFALFLSASSSIISVV